MAKTKLIPNKKSKGYLALKRTLKTTIPIDNIVTDPYIPMIYKKKFFVFLDAYDETVNGEILGYCRNEFFWKRDVKLDKPLYQYLKKYLPKSIFTKTLGRVYRFESFKHRMHQIGSENGLKLTHRKKLFGELLTKAFFSVNELIDFDSKILEKLIDVEYKPMWSYINSNSNDDPYHLTNKKELPCILGLPDDDNGEEYFEIDYITFGFKLPFKKNVFKPTSFDAEFNIYFKPGGKTQKHEECSKPNDRIGFDEYIHEQMKFENIITNIEVIKK